MTVTIITVCLNNDDLDQTIESIVKQSFEDFELIVMDGCSTNSRTIETLVKYQHHPKINIISEQDNGIYDAMNKGITKATGEYLIFVNAGDQLISENVLKAVTKHFNNEDIIYGNLQIEGDDFSLIKEYPSKLSFNYFLKDTLPHPSTFIKRSLFEKFGYYNCNMKISADWAFFINSICRNNVSYKHIPLVISLFKYDGISSKSENQELINNEKNNYLQKNFSAYMTDYQLLDRLESDRLALKNSRVRKYLSIIFKQLKVSEL
ncbi:glycosyltransferase family 2 protein [Pedobacter sp. Leaf132]|uniref:glycosyltransferase family 2 protein n=1 Tax=Pedobacter sp. Leaf132 TaxID=2876557 RepID=UPI001E3D863A|nr:glycosyltransferase family 2 protein [Pedobacter sp. Leaf132]